MRGEQTRKPQKKRLINGNAKRLIDFFAKKTTPQIDSLRAERRYIRCDCHLRTIVYQRRWCAYALMCADNV